MALDDGTSSRDPGERLARLQLLTAALSQAVTSEQVAEAILAHGLETLGAFAGVVYLLTEDRHELVNVCMTGYPEQVAAQWRRLPADAWLPIADAVRRREPVILSSAEEIRERYPEAARFPTLQGEAAAVALPLCIRGEAIGALGLRFPVERAPSEGDHAFLLTLADLCAQALERSQLYDRERIAREAAEREIEVRRRAEAALRESEQRIRTLADNLPQGAIYQVTQRSGNQTQFTYISAGIHTMLGVSPEAVLRDSANLYGLIHQDDAPRMQAAELYSLATGEPFECEFRMWTVTGELRWVQCRSASSRTTGNEVVWDGIVLDITQQKLAEEERTKFVFLADHSSDFIGMCDLAGRPFYVNPAGLQLVGLDSLKEAQEQGLLAFFFPEDQALLRDEFFPRVLAEGQGEVEIRFRHFRTGAPLWMVYSVVTLRDEAGQATGMATISRNITERRAAEEALVEAGKRKDEFLSMLAHELRNPLAPIRNAAHLLRRLSPPDPKLQRLTETVERQSLHLTRLVDDLLDVSRISQGKIVLRQERIALQEILDCAVETSRPALDARQHELFLDFPEEPVWVLGDATRLTQIFANLLHNAVKYTPDGGRIWLSLKIEPEEEPFAPRASMESESSLPVMPLSTVAVRIRDTGVGIPEPLLHQVFDLFTQGDRSLARSEGGLGIGLTMARKLTLLHGGRIEARSAGPGLGSEFTVLLPLADTPVVTKDTE